MEFEQLLKERRSIRAYKKEAVSHELLEKIVTEAQQAPSWANMQASRTYVVEDPEFLEEFRLKALPEGNVKKTLNAALLVTTFVKDTVAFHDGKPYTELGNKWGAYDLGLHDAYLVLAAKNAGLDTLIMGIRYPDAIRECLNIPEEEVIVSVIAAGYRDEEPVDRPRKDPDEVIKYF
ncbi:MAG: nitroreductase family protein [Lachnospiraceae bacterium]|nr:nitroreductase family protein [Lachnospiraceae bacterium]